MTIFADAAGTFEGPESVPRMDAEAGTGDAGYQVRPIRFLDLWRIGGWDMKIYGITADPTVQGRVLEPTFLDAARPVIARTMDEASSSGADAGYGFAILHKGLLGTWLLVDWWSDGIQLYQRTYRGHPDGSMRFERLETGLTACIWELRVLSFEGRAWADTMVRTPPCPAAYLAARLNEDA